MTRLAHLLLVLTSLAPVAFVEAAVALDRHQRCLAGALVIATALLVTVCVLLLWGLARRQSDVPKDVTEPVPKESEPLAFLVAYALPLVGAKPDSGSLLGLGAFVLVMAVAVWQQQLLHMNPLLAILGFHFASAKASDGSQVTIISRTKLLQPGTLRVLRLSESLWVLNTTGGETRGSSTGDP